MTVVAVIFGNSFRNGFVWDDTLYILNNRIYSEFDLTAMFTSLGNGLEYLPVRDISYGLDYALWGDDPAGFHISNIFYYGLTVIAAYLLVRRIAAAAAADSGRGAATGIAAALLFAVHPLHSEVASFLTCRNALLSTLFFFCSAILYLRYLDGASRRSRLLCYGGALACFMLSLFSKANGIILPFVLIYLTLCVSRRRRWRDLLPTIPFLAMSGAAFFLFIRIATTANIIREAASVPSHGGFRFPAVKMLNIVSFYIEKFVAPVGLTAEYAFRLDTSLSDPANIAAIAGAAIALFAAVRYRRTKPYLATAVVWYLITLIPVLNILPTYPVVADRYAFLPSFAFAYLIAAAVVDLCWSSPRLRAAGLGLLFVLTCWWSVLTVSQNSVWRTSETLWEHTVFVTPESGKAHSNLGRILFVKGEFARAFEHFEMARRININDPHFDFFQGIVHLGRNEMSEARSSFERALQRNPSFTEALMQMGMLLEKQGELGEAAAYYRRALSSPQLDAGNFRNEVRERLSRIQPENREVQ